jgi:hypothetical protein
VTLADALADWTDADGACFELGVHLGLFDSSEWYARKGLFWTDNPLGNGLYDALVALAAAGVLEHREEPDNQFRWAGLAP